MRDVVSLVRRTLARLAIDTSNGRQVLRVESGTAAQSIDFASGPAGAALAFLELYRATEEQRWSSIASEAALHAGRARPSGSGMFSGPEGLQAVHAAVSGRHEPLCVHDYDRLAPGDLMNGRVGIHWAEMCLRQPTTRSTRSPVVQDYESGMGLAHGYLGVVATLGSETTTTERLRMTREQKPPTKLGWCNGMAGYLATLAGLHSDPDAQAEMTAMAHELARSSDSTNDGLCHGTAGRIAVLAGAARLLGDDDLLVEAQEQASHLAARVSDSGFRLNDGFVLDHSWLTGTSGVCWGLLSAFKQPVINPLLPQDSIFGGDVHDTHQPVDRVSS